MTRVRSTGIYWSGQVRKVSQQLEPKTMAFFRMKLNAGDVPSFDGGHEFIPIARGHEDIGLFPTHHMVRMNE